MVIANKYPVSILRVANVLARRTIADSMLAWMQSFNAGVSFLRPSIVANYIYVEDVVSACLQASMAYGTYIVTDLVPCYFVDAALTL